MCVCVCVCVCVCFRLSLTHTHTHTHTHTLSLCLQISFFCTTSAFEPENWSPYSQGINEDRFKLFCPSCSDSAKRAAHVRAQLPELRLELRRVQANQKLGCRPQRRRSGPACCDVSRHRWERVSGRRRPVEMKLCRSLVVSTMPQFQLHKSASSVAL